MRNFVIQYLNYEGGTPWTEVEVNDDQGESDARLKAIEDDQGDGDGIKEIIQCYEGAL